MKFRNLFGQKLGTIDPDTGEPIIDVKLKKESSVVRLVLAHENLHYSEWQRARQYGTPPLPRPDEEAVAWLETLREAERMGGIPDSERLKTTAGRNFCDNLRMLRDFYFKNGGGKYYDVSNSDIQAMDVAFRELEKTILGHEGPEQMPERRG